MWKRILRNNGLSLALLGAFLVFISGQAITGHLQYNQDRSDHGQPRIGFAEYLRSSHFLEATAENWESEFLQMSAYVLLTVFLYQRGSSESKDPDEREPADREPAIPLAPKDVPWPVRRGGVILKVYENSLSLAFLALFLICVALHAIGGAGQYNEEQWQHGGTPVSVLGYLGTSRFWFESFQNWQSEFLAMGAMVILSIFLRQKGSPESKRIDSPHSQTGK